MIACPTPRLITALLERPRRTGRLRGIVIMSKKLGLEGKSGDAMSVTVEGEPAQLAVVFKGRVVASGPKVASALWEVATHKYSMVVKGWRNTLYDDTCEPDDPDSPDMERPFIKTTKFDKGLSVTVKGDRKGEWPAKLAVVLNGEVVAEGRKVVDEAEAAVINEWQEFLKRKP